jgi:outer membrane biogenesis lipoprotein LolB
MNVKAVLILGFAALLLTACSTASHESRLSPSSSLPETVLVMYHAKAGKEGY